MYGEHKKIAFCCYAGAFVSLFIKSLCGYEYITVIMLAMISFLLADFVLAVLDKNKTAAIKIAKHIVCLGIFAVIGFVAALLIHAKVKGSGNIFEGLKLIYKNDVLRRTLGGNVENFAPVYKDSFEASITTVIRMYFNFYTEITSGIAGKFFTVFSLLPIFIFSYKSFLGKSNAKKIVLYFVFFATCISWFVLGKSHSYIHTHMNYVLWYFGFAQICFYIIIDEILCFAKSKPHILQGVFSKWTLPSQTSPGQPMTTTLFMCLCKNTALQAWKSRPQKFLRTHLMTNCMRQKFGQTI